MIPYGGGSSVVGGIEPRFDGPARDARPRALDRVLEIDRTSRAARIQAGVLGPHLEDQLRPHGLTLRHFPQSFAFSTLGGWLATRAGGHFATLYTHIDDLTESMRVVTPVGHQRVAPAPGLRRRALAGPAVPRLRGHPRRDHRGLDAAAGPAALAGHAPRSPSTTTGAAVAATRAIAQSGLYPANCRLLDAAEALLNAGTTVTGGLLVLGVRVGRPSGRPVAGPGASRSLATTAAAAGRRTRGDEQRDDAAATLALVVPADAVPPRRGSPGTAMIVETFETACTWDRFEAVHAAVTTAAQEAVERVCGAGVVTCRFTHVYPDGPAPYLRDLRPRSVGQHRSPSGTRSRRPSPRRSPTTGPRSPTTTRSAATTVPGTTASGRTSSRRRWAPRVERSTRPASSTRAYCWTPEQSEGPCI